MSLLEEAKPHIRHSGGTCGVPAILDQLPDAERAELLAWFALKPPRYPPATAIVGALKQRKLPIGESSINRHARGGCQCL